MAAAPICSLPVQRVKYSRRIAEIGTPGLPIYPLFRPECWTDFTLNMILIAYAPERSCPRADRYAVHLGSRRVGGG